MKLKKQDLIANINVKSNNIVIKVNFLKVF